MRAPETGRPGSNVGTSRITGPMLRVQGRITRVRYRGKNKRENTVRSGRDARKHGASLSVFDLTVAFKEGNGAVRAARVAPGQSMYLEGDGSLFRNAFISFHPSFEPMNCPRSPASSLLDGET